MNEKNSQLNFDIAVKSKTCIVAKYSILTLISFSASSGQWLLY